MKLLLCGKCNGEFSEKMNVEMLGDKPHHSYCASAVLKEQRAQQQASQQNGNFFSRLLTQRLEPQ